MTDLEKAETERIACDLAEAVHSMNNLNKEQIEYLDIIFKKLFIDKEFEKIQKNIVLTPKPKEKVKRIKKGGIRNEDRS